jgi:V/A-type H+-transporting ATPase subunit K
LKTKTRMFVMFLLFPIAFLPVAAAAALYTVSSGLAQVQSQVNTTTPGVYDRIGIAIGAGIAVGLAALGAGLAISSAGTAAISALAEKPDTFFRSFLVVALAEALAIYGLIMGILLWIKL